MSKIELVTKPYVKIIAKSSMIHETMEDFIDRHGLTPLTGDTPSSTPIGRLREECGREIDLVSDLDNLSEFAGRFCYRSWDKGRSQYQYLKHTIESKHGSIFAHPTVSFIITGVSRSLSHELVRHHVGTNPSQESQRYVMADIEVIGWKATRAVVPPMVLLCATGDSWASEQVMENFQLDFSKSLETYQRWVKIIEARYPTGFVGQDTTMRRKRVLEAARAFLPNACETRLIFTMNLRAARNILEQRANIHADLEIRRMAMAMYWELIAVAPGSFADIEPFFDEDGLESLRVGTSKI